MQEEVARFDILNSNLLESTTQNLRKSRQESQHPGQDKLCISHLHFVSFALLAKEHKMAAL
jgi:hypothetical protein